MSKKKRISRAKTGFPTRLVKYNKIEIEDIMEDNASKYAKLMDRDKDSLRDYLMDQYSPQYGKIIHDLVRHYNDKKYSGYAKMQIVVYAPRLFSKEENILREITPWDFRYGMMEFSRDYQGHWDTTDVLQIGDDPQELLYQYLYAKPSQLLEDEVFSPAKVHLMLTNQNTQDWRLNKETIFHKQFTGDKYFGWSIENLELNPSNKELDKELTYIKPGVNIFQWGLNEYINHMIKDDPSLRFKNPDLLIPGYNFRRIINSAGSIAEQIFEGSGDGHHKVSIHYRDGITRKIGKETFEWNNHLGTFSTQQDNIDCFTYPAASYWNELNVPTSDIVLQSFNKDGKKIMVWRVTEEKIVSVPEKEIHNIISIDDYKTVTAFNIIVDENYMANDDVTNPVTTQDSIEEKMIEQAVNEDW